LVDGSVFVWFSSLTFLSFFLQKWNPKAIREGYAPSAVEVLRIIDETLDAFFYLPLSKDPQYVKKIVAGVDQCARKYCQATLAGCGKNVVC
jgi:hypothetical protein